LFDVEGIHDLETGERKAFLQILTKYNKPGAVILYGIPKTKKSTCGMKKSGRYIQGIKSAMPRTLKELPGQMTTISSLGYIHSEKMT